MISLLKSIFDGTKSQPTEVLKPKMTKDGIDMIKAHEGERLVVYADPIGLATVGYGHLVMKGESFKIGDTITKETAENLLIKDLKMAEDGVLGAVKVPINDDIFSALVSFTFNVGTANLSKSTLLKLLNSKKYEEAADQFDKWVFAGGKKFKGLVSRRSSEKKMFLKGVEALKK